MLFHSFPFLLVFLPAVLAVYWAVAPRRGRRPALLVLSAASLGFYAWWDWRFVVLLAASVVINFTCARRLAALSRDAARQRRALLTAGIIANLAPLAYFKYGAFVIENVQALWAGFGPAPALALPLAISFVTFEQIAYLVDGYRGTVPAHDFPSYCAYVTFFPRLIAGPIVRPGEILPQFANPATYRFCSSNVATGVLVFTLGLFKKVWLADTFAPWTANVFDHLAQPSFTDAWGGVLAFGLQVYFDFSGYTDMAVGLARFFNITLPENFDSPYQADSLIDYWRRWHMTLTRFLRDYVYIPLGGNRHGQGRQDLNLLATMTLGGLWHGAAWTFVVWGALHGVLLIVNHLWRRHGPPLPRVVAWPLTLVTVFAAYTLFRAPSFARVAAVGGGLFGLNGFAWHSSALAVGGNQFKWLLLGLAFVMWAPNRQRVVAWRWSNDWAYAVAVATLVVLSVLHIGAPAPFFYFQF